ncbi:MAG: transglutaminase-like domain-containing protein [Candidatus Kariarchaeaceae archaeon]|jgi:transglutaminase-like putative cysteine protease
MSTPDYLSPTFFIDSEATSVRQIATHLSKDKQNTTDQVISIFNHVRDNIKYKIDMSIYSDHEDFKASATLERKIGFCIPKSIALVSLFRACDIPARLHFADIINHRSPAYLVELMGTNVFYFHGYAEVFVRNEWFKLTPSFETELCQKHNFPVCVFNGKTDATFPRTDLLNQPFVEYINDRGVYADLPFSEMVSVFQQYYSYHFE